METKSYARAVRVHGEVIVLHCWACGTAHCVNQELCVPGELSQMVCSNSNCRMSMFLVSELAADNDIETLTTRNALGAPFVALSRFWR